MRTRLVLTLYKRGRRAAECMATANDEIAGKPVRPEVMASAFGTDDPKGAALQKLMTDEDPDEPEDMMERIEALSAYFDFPLVPDREISDRCTGKRAAVCCDLANCMTV